MLDTNLINVENIKATVVKIKEWVQELYPFSYIGGNFKIFNNTNKDHVILESANSGSTLSQWSSVLNIKTKLLRLKSTIVNIVTGGSKIEINGSGLKIVGNNVAVLGFEGADDDSSYVKCVKADGITVVNADQSIICKDANGNSIKFVDGDIIVKDADDSDGCLYLGINPSDVWADSHIPYAVYNGTPNRMGYINSGTTKTNFVRTTTTFSGWTTSTDFLLKRNLKRGVWLVTASLKSEEVLTAGKRIGIALYLEDGVGAGTYTQIKSSKQIISHGANAYGSAQCSAVVVVPYYANVNDDICIQLRGFQTTGNKEYTATINCVKLA